MARHYMQGVAEPEPAPVEAMPTPAPVSDDPNARYTRCERHGVTFLELAIPDWGPGWWHAPKGCAECEQERNLAPKVEETLRAREADRIARISKRLEEQESDLQASVDSEFKRLAAEWRADIEADLRNQLAAQVRTDVTAEMSQEIFEELKGNYGN